MFVRSVSLFVKLSLDVNIYNPSNDVVLIRTQKRD